MSVLHLLHFTCQEVHFCIELTAVEKVITLAKIDAYPNAPHFLVGLLNYAGENIPVINLAMRFGFTQNKAYDIDAPIIICAYNQKKLGLLVDNIFSVVSLAQQAVQTPMELAIQSSPVKGIVNIGTTIALQLNLVQVANLDSIIVKEQLEDAAALNQVTHHG